MLGLVHGQTAADLGDLPDALRLARLEQLDDAWQAVRDVGAGHTAGVEGTHGELRARLADGLGGDVAHGVADLGLGVGRQADAVALLADADAASHLSTLRTGTVGSVSLAALQNLENAVRGPRR